MQAVKDNCVYTITTDAEAEAYKARGFDIYDDKGKLKEHGAGKTVPYEEHEKVLTENKKLKAELAKLKKAEGGREQ